MLRAPQHRKCEGRPLIEAGTDLPGVRNARDGHRHIEGRRGDEWPARRVSGPLPCRGRSGFRTGPRRPVAIGGNDLATHRDRDPARSPLAGTMATPPPALAPDRLGCGLPPAGDLLRRAARRLRRDHRLPRVVLAGPRPPAGRGRDAEPDRSAGLGRPRLLVRVRARAGRGAPEPRPRPAPAGDRRTGRSTRRRCRPRRHVQLQRRRPPRRRRGRALPARHRPPPGVPRPRCRRGPRPPPLRRRRRRRLRRRCLADRPGPRRACRALGDAPRHLRAGPRRPDGRPGRRGLRPPPRPGRLPRRPLVAGLLARTVAEPSRPPRPAPHDRPPGPIEPRPRDPRRRVQRPPGRRRLPPPPPRALRHLRRRRARLGRHHPERRPRPPDRPGLVRPLAVAARRTDHSDHRMVICDLVPSHSRAAPGEGRANRPAHGSAPPSRSGKSADRPGPRR